MTARRSILIIDDERGTREAMGKFLRPDYDVTLAEDGEKGINLLNRNHYDLILSDIRMEPGPSGLDVLAASLKLSPPPPCILFTAYGSIETAVEAVKQGAFDFVTKPVNFDRLEIIIRRALESVSLKEENTELKRKLGSSFGVKGMIGNSAKMKNIIETVEQVAPTRTTVLITGESGTGKELVAQAIHQCSGRTGKFVPVHCSALPDNLIESELFGHERGAFTGAVEMRKGRFELAEGGTIFLDEIGEIPLHIQVKLLRVLENRAFERIGGSETIITDARVVAATNRDLKKMVEEGTFREDLFYRLDVVSLEIPPLRERKEDIPLLVKHYLDVFNKENGKDIGITETAMASLCAYAWPGNIRELRNCVERMVVLCRGKMIDLENVPVDIREGVTPGIAKTVLSQPSCDLECNEKMLIERALNECGGNRTKAAEKLGISRRTLHRKLHTYNLE
ncbi:MAG: sigma-54 dependent transcriptional regulator [Victivallales bacterium]|nr:sigma-54 dependent transcriptional regulator [bacterium]MDD7752031.1 sigma-54 dependent transcriptional regulator [bacterium]MDY5695713.1 sigma-54 dependent transcriptional regulator [Victivallales bacterium]